MGELVRYFLRLGLLGFGGPVALVGQMERELVTERGWLTKDEMREVIAVCQSLPGPLAIQVGIFISYLRAGFWGAWAGGWGFILPNFLIVAALGALYVHFGALQPVTAIFYGVSPVVIALILHSCYRLAKLGMEDALQWGIAAVCFLVTVVLKAEVALLFIAAGALGVLYYGTLWRRPPTTTAMLLAVPMGPVANCSIIGKLLLFFLKAGALTFGSGLVLVPFLQQGVVQGRDGGHLFALVPADFDRCADLETPPCQSQRSGVRQGRLRCRHRNHLRCMRSLGSHRHRGLAHRSHRCGLLGAAVSLESQQPRIDCSRRRDRLDCIPAAASSLADGALAPKILLPE
jgi:chromate transport protein ChrA